jgi:UDP-N-acetylmuramate--alanine ligase
MNLYISGISGTGMGPLALMAKAAGHTVFGSDRAKGAIAPELEAAGIEYFIGDQDGSYLAEKMQKPGIDWFIYTSALPADHPELLLAKEQGIRASKRDELIAELISALGLKMTAVAGTHGKTTTTAMLVWTVLNLTDPSGSPLLPSSYLVGTTLGFAPSGSYKENDRFFIYEADEYDRNFLHFNPWLALITYVSYDHPDIYPTEEDYKAAFAQFESQSENILFGTPAAAPADTAFLTDAGRTCDTVAHTDPRISISGAARREDATTAFYAIKKMLAAQRGLCPDDTRYDVPDERIIDILNAFPGVGRRFEKLCDGVYTDYAHHPEEVATTIAMAREEAAKTGKRGVVAVYQPHQNTRQHEVRHLYPHAFDGADRLYWLPTYLTRENESLAILTPADFIRDLSIKDRAAAAELNDSLADTLKRLQNDGYLILLMTAGPADGWLRKIFR